MMVELSVCIGSSCHLKGSYNVIQTFQHLIEENALHDKVDFKATFCMKRCERPGVAVLLDGEEFSITPETAREFFKTTVMPRAL
ncbi:MAG: (2Fe-2S) ferredoxin domain-containing protein [Candidatus Gastranaerophilaceae bacterium]|nr:(2Fe-2S) ferredoxin domain-containing protein [Christensenellales bacterium]